MTSMTSRACLALALLCYVSQLCSSAGGGPAMQPLAAVRSDLDGSAYAMENSHQANALPGAAIGTATTQNAFPGARKLLNRMSADLDSPVVQRPQRRLQQMLFYYPWYSTGSWRGANPRQQRSTVYRSAVGQTLQRNYGSQATPGQSGSTAGLQSGYVNSVGEYTAGSMLDPSLITQEQQLGYTTAEGYTADPAGTLLPVQDAATAETAGSDTQQYGNPAQDTAAGGLDGSTLTGSSPGGVGASVGTPGPAGQSTTTDSPPGQPAPFIGPAEQPTAATTTTTSSTTSASNTATTQPVQKQTPPTAPVVVDGSTAGSRLADEPSPEGEAVKDSEQPSLDAPSTPANDKHQASPDPAAPVVDKPPGASEDKSAPEGKEGQPSEVPVEGTGAAKDPEGSAAAPIIPDTTDDAAPPFQEVPVGSPLPPSTAESVSLPNQDGTAAPAQGAYCIPVSRQNYFNVLAAGDSITQGSVPSKGVNHPYAWKLEELLKANIGSQKVRAVDAGLGGGGIYQEGFNIKQQFPEYYRDQLSRRRWDVAVIFIGINDLLRGGTPADKIWEGLRVLFQETLDMNIPIVAIPPFAAPGFVQENDPKEAERKKLATLLHQAAEQRQAATGGAGPQIWVLDLQAGPLDFYKMSPEERGRWLDDGLHMTQYGYDQLGQYVYEEISKHLCELPPMSVLDLAAWLVVDRVFVPGVPGHPHHLHN